MIMKTSAVQTAGKNIVSMALADIQPGSYNPRKNFDETSLAELAESIEQQGVLQPIGVRPIADNRFEIVFGERRYRASLMAGLTEIPAVVMDISAEEAGDMAITENLQREDVTPIEEANAYQKLIDSGRHDVQSLAVQFGKTEAYIRTRLKFTTLIPEIALLLEQDEITVSVASEICRYGEEIQREVYDKHLKEDVQYGSWRGLKAADVARSIERQYTADLNRYSFDKTLCLSCPHNTNNMMLFREGGCGNCANRSCLAEMNTSYLVEKAMQMLAEHSTASLAHKTYNYNEAAVEHLIALGYEVETLDAYTNEYPKTPIAPEKDDYDTPEEYEEAEKEYGEDMNGYKEECDDLLRKSEEGGISIYVTIEQNRVALCYMENTRKANGTATEKPLSPVEKLEKQDRRNKEIAHEKTVEDTKKKILEVDMSERKFGQDEDRMIYFFMLSLLRKEHYTAVGLDEERPCLSDKDKMDIIATLTPKAKAVIRRDFLIAHFKEAYGDNAVAALLLDFAGKHMPEELANIQNGHNEVYEKRHQRIEEKKAVLLAQEQARQEAEQPDEPQPEAETQAEPQTEEIAA